MTAKIDAQGFMLELGGQEFRFNEEQCRELVTLIDMRYADVVFDCSSKADKLARRLRDILDGDF